MIFILRLLLIGILSYLSIHYLPWWSVLVVAGVVSFAIGGKGSHAFFSSLLAVGVLWMVMNYMLYVQDGGFLADKVSQMMQVNNAYLLIVLSGLITGLCAGFGGLSGQALRSIFSGKKRSRSSYYNG